MLINCFTLESHLVSFVSHNFASFQVSRSLNYHNFIELATQNAFSNVKQKEEENKKKGI